MRRKSISASEYSQILSELVVTGMHTNVMSITLGTHDIHGRVVLLQCGTGFVLLADRLESSRESLDDNYVLRAVNHWAEAATETRS